MQQISIKSVKPGDYIKRKIDAQTVYIKGAYDRATKSFECTDTNNINRQIYIKADKPVFVGFTYWLGVIMLEKTLDFLCIFGGICLGYYIVFLVIL